MIVARSGTCCQTVGLLGRYVTRTHLKSPLMDYIKAKSVVLRNPGENTVNVDGEELTYQDELKMEVCEAGVTCYGELWGVCSTHRTGYIKRTSLLQRRQARMFALLCMAHP